MEERKDCADIIDLKIGLYYTTKKMTSARQDPAGNDNELVVKWRKLANYTEWMKNPPELLPLSFSRAFFYGDHAHHADTN